MLNIIKLNKSNKMSKKKIKQTQKCMKKHDKKLVLCKFLVNLIMNKETRKIKNEN